MGSQDRTGRVPLLIFGGTAVAVICCAGLPLLAGVLAGVSVAALAGAGAAGVVILGAVAAALGVVRARRRTCRSDKRVEGMN